MTKDYNLWSWSKLPGVTKISLFKPTRHKKKKLIISLVLLLLLLLSRLVVLIGLINKLLILNRDR